MEMKNEKILFVHSANLPCESVLRVLRQVGYETTLASSFSHAKDIILKSNFKAILSEKKLPDGSGIDVLNFVRKIGSTPFILITDAPEAEKSACDILNYASMAKSFQEKDFILILEKLIQAEEEAAIIEGAELVNSDENFSSISIEEFISGNEIKYDIFIKIGAQNFIKMSHGNEGFTDGQIQKLKERGVDFLFMRKKDFQNYIAMTVNLIKFLPKVEIPAHRKSLFIKQTTRILSQSVMLQMIDGEAVTHANSVVDATINMLIGHGEILFALELLQSSRGNIYTHSLNVAVYSVLIARQMTWNSYSTQVKLAAAGIFHDIGMTQIPLGLLEIPESELQPVEVKVINEHVVKSVEMLKAIKDIPDDIVNIVKHHHEEPSGQGYPLKLNRTQIHPLAKIVRVADDFCEQMSHKTPSLSTIMETIVSMEAERLKYDTDCLIALKTFFKRRAKFKVA